MLLVATTFPCDTGVFELLYLWHPLPFHFLVLVVQPAAQEDAEDEHVQTECSADPRALAVIWLLRVWEAVDTQEWPALTYCGQNGVPARSSAFRGVYVRCPGQ